MGALGMAALVLVLVAMACAFSALLGVAASWVFAHFGVQVAWHVCSVAIFVLGFVFRSGASVK